ncbi:hypothetical protein GJ744_010182 [Endocarpon pusillum]|uniref:Uncharacterized protein n=1 Tax=Endocarpon pusillum TaxID=364733 RepID=A0A8H7AER4_9EURO|nr:hypothetical protein GJ744_010182 [Endocarpon pusillum]
MSRAAQLNIDLDSEIPEDDALSHLELTGTSDLLKYMPCLQHTQPKKTSGPIAADLLSKTAAMV